MMAGVGREEELIREHRNLFGVMDAFIVLIVEDSLLSVYVPQTLPTCVFKYVQLIVCR